MSQSDDRSTQDMIYDENEDNFDTHRSINQSIASPTHSMQSNQIYQPATPATVLPGKIAYNIAFNITITMIFI